jgi:heparosan-N-sulfate-glucuronate 5-epimerase
VTDRIRSSSKAISRRAGRRGMRELLGSRTGNPDAFGSEQSFNPPIGGLWSPSGAIRGYYIDFSLKAESPGWPPYWLAALEQQLHVAAVLWGLGAFERYLKGEGEEWLAGARAAGKHLIETQQRGGNQQGAWRHHFRMPHTYRIDPPWLSGITQGQAASLLARLFVETAEERFAEAATAALLPMQVPVSEGGTVAELDGEPFVEEYPTDPPSYVLNGAIFAIWGFRDVGLLFDDSDSVQRFSELAATLDAQLGRWDTGKWSLYDLYPHSIANLASPAYHLLHIGQLRVMDQLAEGTRFGPAAERFDAYRSSRRNRTEAVARKIAFRLANPRNAAAANRFPWASQAAARRRAGRGGAAASKQDRLVLCYHAVSPDWDALISVTPSQLSEQLHLLLERGYRGVTFSDAVLGDPGGRVVAITFDDGYRSVPEQALPILVEMGFPATVFLPTDFIGSEQPMSWPGIDSWQHGPHAPELRPMSWEQAGDLAAAGWEIGSHTRSHPRLTDLSDERLAEELVESRLECERHLGRPCSAVAFPFGDYDERVSRAAAEAGYEAAATLPGRTPEPHPLAWPRVGIYHLDGEGSFRLKVSPAIRRLRRSSAWVPIAKIIRPMRGRGAGPAS